MLCWVLGLLVLPTVSPLVLAVSAGEGVVAFSLVVGGGAGVGVEVTGPGFERGWLGVAGCGRSPLLAEGLVGLPMCPSGVSGGSAAPLAGVAGFLFFGCFCAVCICDAGGARALVCGVRLWGSCRWRLWLFALCARVGMCAVCWWCVWVPVLAFLGLVWRLCVGVVAVCRDPSPVPAVGSGCGSPPPLAGVCWWWCVPPLPPLHALPPLSLCRVAWGGVPLVPCRGLPGCGGWGGKVFVAGSGPFPWCFP